MKEIIIYTIAAIGSLFIFGYSIHMFIGGLVDEKTETIAITIGCIIAAGAMAFLAWDVVKRRKQ